MRQGEKLKRKSSR